MTCTHHSLSADNSLGPPGTLAYMAPELVAGAKCDHSCDIYSFGVLLQEILTGVRLGLLRVA
jgi:serine/threonine protein kinase